MTVKHTKRKKAMTAQQKKPSDAVRSLYDFKANTFDEVLQVQSDFEKMKVVKLPVKRHKIAATVKDETTKKADDTPTKVRQIGFKKQDDTGNTNDTNDTEKVENTADTKIVGGGIVGNCKHCSKSFVKNHKKQIYCQDSCRIADYEQRSGKKLEYAKNKK